MKKYTSILVALILAVLVSTTAAQPRNSGQATATVEVSATVVSASNVDVKQQLAFGKVNHGSRPRLDPTFKSNKDVGEGARNGKAVILGAEGSIVNIDLDQSSYKMQNGNESEGPAFSPSLMGSEEDNGDAAELIYNNGKEQNRDIELGSEGRYYLFMGGELGSIDQSSQRVWRGTYSTTVKVNVTYN